MAQWHLPPSCGVYFKGLNPLIYTCKEKKKIIVRINLIHIKLGDMNKLWFFQHAAGNLNFTFMYPPTQKLL